MEEEKKKIKMNENDIVTLISLIIISISIIIWLCLRNCSFSSSITEIIMEGTFFIIPICLILGLITSACSIYNDHKINYFNSIKYNKRSNNRSALFDAFKNF